MSKSTITLFALCLALCSSALASTVPNSPWTSGEYDYDGSGNIRAIGAERYVYDPLGRLVSGSVGGKTQTYEYDGFGNLKKIAVAGGPTRQVPINSQTNRLSSVMYDAAGNQLNDGLVTQVRTYDAFNSMTVNLDGTQYLYDANDERIAIANPERTEWRYTIRDASAKVMREFVETGPAGGSMTLNWKRDYVYRGSALLGSYVKEGASVKRLHYHLDHLGTPRLTTDAAAIGRYAVADYPFGEEVDPITNTSETRRFTGHERDYNAGGTLDYMHARFYSPENGRFLSIDPGKDWDANQPQSWNLYAYARNNPVNRIDPDGRRSDAPLNHCRGSNSGPCQRLMKNYETKKPFSTDGPFIGMMTQWLLAAAAGAKDPEGFAEGAAVGGALALQNALKVEANATSFSTKRVVLATVDGAVGGAIMNGLFSVSPATKEAIKATHATLGQFASPITAYAKGSAGAEIPIIGNGTSTFFCLGDSQCTPVMVTPEEKAKEPPPKP